MLNQKLILFHYFLNTFGFQKFESLQKEFKDLELHANTPENSILYQKLCTRNLKMTILDLKKYEDNIIKHMGQINHNRKEKISLKYYQYFTIMFTEFYLDQYFNNKQLLLDSLNNFKNEFLKEKTEDISDYSLEQLNKLAFWMATGSGKTFILHFNILQYKHYCEDINNIILLTPSENLSKQHLEELKLSGISADGYLNNKAGNHVKVIDIFKIREIKSGKGVTIGISEFGQDNAIFVDEGHKGNATDDGLWKKIRTKLGYKGFTFEYSATFGQISNEELKYEYAKSILFDYSYKYFYKDGYGKDYWIHNISNDNSLEESEVKRRYLLLNLLLFTQQKYYFESNRATSHEFNLENPLLAFVGHTVNASATRKQDKEDNKETISDVVVILDFLNDFLINKEKYVNWMEDIFNNRGIFSEDYFLKLHFLRNTINNSEKVYRFIIELVFNGSSPDKIELYNIQNAPGEIGIKVKGSKKYFALINIGDVSAFKQNIQEKYSFEVDYFTLSLFDSLATNSEKPINILIGAKKFIEGWNSFRVSSIGLINFGRAEGSQVIQLFGRGVRLRGKDNSLKRTDGTGPENISLIETLNIFGLNANYMKQFKKELESGGVTAGRTPLTFPIKTKKNINELDLITLSKKTNIPEFNTSNILELKEDSNIKVQIDISTKRFSFNSQNVNPLLVKEPVSFDIPTPFLNYIDWYEIGLELLEYKQTKSYYNLKINQSDLKNLVVKLDYSLIADDYLKIESINDIERIQKIVIILLKKYIELYYNRYLRIYEGKHLQVVPLSTQDSNFTISSYELRVLEVDKDGKISKDIDTVIEQVKNVIDDIHYPENLKLESSLMDVSWFDDHLYQPLLNDEDGQQLSMMIESITPKGLNKGESKFVEDLQTYLKVFKSQRYENLDFYLLRNYSRGKGFGFYFSSAGGFYPDFMLWIKKDDMQFLTFIDPHGLRNEAEHFESPKIGLSKAIKELEKELNNEKLKLNSFILIPPPSKISDLKSWKIPEGSNLYEHANKLNVYEINQENGLLGEFNYIGAIIEKILERN